MSTTPRKPGISMPIHTRRQLSIAAMQIKQPVVVIPPAKPDTKLQDELDRYRRAEMRAASAALTCDLLGEQRRRAQARHLHVSRTSHVRDNTAPAPQKVTLTKDFVHTTQSFDPVRAVPLPVPWWRRLRNWFRSELE